MLRSGARPGDSVCVSGPLGGAALALETANLAASVPGRLSGLEHCYWRPQPPFALASRLRSRASSCIDVSDGLRQDLDRLCRASGLGASLNGAALPLAPGAEPGHALGASDDYVLCFTTRDAGLRREFAVIGAITDTPGLLLDGRPAEVSGYSHF